MKGYNQEEGVKGEIRQQERRKKIIKLLWAKGHKKRKKMRILD